jgi:hypothetical protein
VIATLKLAAERVAATYLEAWAALMILAANGQYNLSLVEGAAVAAIPAGANAIIAFVPAVDERLPFWYKLLFNVVRTFGVTFLGYVGALALDVGDPLDPSVLVAAGTAGLAAALAVFKGGLSKFVGNPTSPNVVIDTVATPADVVG